MKEKWTDLENYSRYAVRVAAIYPGNLDNFLLVFGEPISSVLASEYKNAFYNCLIYFSVYFLK